MRSKFLKFKKIIQFTVAKNIAKEFNYPFNEIEFI